MKDVSDVIACVVDHGLFLPVAQKLAEQYGKVFYWTPWDRTCPKLEDGIVGDGFENITRVPNIWDIKDQCDLFVFPDIGFGGLQKELIHQGKNVWGHRGGDVLETNRGLFLKTLERVGLDIPPHEIVTGMSALRDHLKDKKDRWIKISKWRGDWETLHWRDWEHDESLLDQYSYRFGPAKEIIKFYVFEPIETDIEDGVDTYCIDGKFPDLVMHGMECKDKSYLCSMQPLRDVDDRVSEVNKKFSPVLEEYGYRGLFSTEVRIGEEGNFFIDPTCRAASPPSQVMLELFGNIGEIIWRGSQGECIEPEPTAQFGVQAIIKSERDPDEWEVMDVPDDIRQWVKCGFACEIGGRICIPPHQLGTMIGWVVATGDSIKEAIDNLKSHCEELPDGVDCNVDSLAKLLDEAQSAKDQGIEITEQKIPEPSSVI